MNLHGYPVNGGSNPAYQWYVNNVAAGTNAAAFTTSSLVNGDVVTVVLTSDLTPCATGNPATSNAITMVVNNNLPVSVTIASDASIIPSVLVPVTFTATPVRTAVVQTRLTSGM